MPRTELILHLINNDCYPIDEYDVPGVSQCWRNAINGHEAYVPYVDELMIKTWGLIFNELCIDPPLHNGYDSDYAVFSSFRTGLMQKIKEDIKNK